MCVFELDFIENLLFLTTLIKFFFLNFFSQVLYLFKLSC